jgi:hypothetical protein
MGNYRSTEPNCVYGFAIVLSYLTYAYSMIMVLGRMAKR